MAKMAIMNRRKRQQTFGLILLLLIGLAAAPMVLTYQQLRQTQLNHALIAAVDCNDAGAVRRLLRQGANPNAQMLPDDKRPVWHRLWGLMQHQIVHQDRSRHGLAATVVSDDTALMRAIERHATDDFRYERSDNADTVSALVAAGANVNVRIIGGFGQGTPLITAVWFQKWKTVKVLLAQPVEINATDGAGATALLVAVRWRNREVVEALLNRRANVNIHPPSGGTPLMWAALHHDDNLVERLIRAGARVNDRNSIGDSALLYALLAISRIKPNATVACLLQHGAVLYGKDDYGRSERSLAGIFDDPSLIQMLKRAGAKGERKKP